MREVALKAHKKRGGKLQGLEEEADEGTALHNARRLVDPRAQPLTQRRVVGGGLDPVVWPRDPMGAVWVNCPRAERLQKAVARIWWRMLGG